MTRFSSFFRVPLISIIASLMIFCAAAGAAWAACGEPGPVPPAEGFRWPVAAGITRGWTFDCQTGRGHRGIDIGAAPGSPVEASASGVVAFAGYTPAEGGGFTMTIDHVGGMRSTYLHLDEPAVKKGDRVTQGQRIAVAGDSPLHFGIKLQDGSGSYFDPLAFLPPLPAAAGGEPDAAVLPEPALESVELGDDPVPLPLEPPVTPPLEPPAAAAQFPEAAIPFADTAPVPVSQAESGEATLGSGEHAVSPAEPVTDYSGEAGRAPDADAPVAAGGLAGASPNPADEPLGYALPAWPQIRGAAAARLALTRPRPLPSTDGIDAGGGRRLLLGGVALALSVVALGAGRLARNAAPDALWSGLG